MVGPCAAAECAYDEAPRLPCGASKKRWADISGDESTDAGDLKDLASRWADFSDDDEDAEVLSAAVPAAAAGPTLLASSAPQATKPKQADPEESRQSWEGQRGSRRKGRTDSSASSSWEDPYAEKWSATSQYASFPSCEKRNRGKAGGAKGDAVGSGKGAGKGKDAQPQRWSRQKGVGKGASGKRQCQFVVGIAEDPEFKAVRQVLGPHGAHMKSIAEESGAKLRLRGRGSKFLEGPEQRESTDPLMLCVSAPDPACYAEALRLTTRHLEDVYSKYRAFCARTGRPTVNVAIEFHEGARDGAA